MVAFRGIPGCLNTRFMRECRENSGAELIEAALVIPILLMLLLGIVWLGRAYNVYETITRAAREGARYAVLPSCATCNPANQMTETYTSAGTTSSPACISNPTYEFTNYVAPSLLASHLDPNDNVVQQTFCQQAVVMNPTSDTSSQQCGIEVSFEYPLQLAIPFTSLNASTISIPTSVTMRMENQPVDGSTGQPTCP
ncbi:MAG: pilus assembly protein [Acidobacteria bacterium]|nr:MAG: pilus assembly protein [Acidobacteriota bacterium]